MDWKYIYSIQANKIDDNEKDALLNTLAWYDIDVEEVDLEKCLILFKISQEIMKFKSEQVEVLVAELDELAKKQAEDELKKEFDSDLKSQSKKSSSLDFDELEEKYRELRSKLKERNKVNEKLKHEITKLNQHVKVLEQDRNHLQNELQTLQKDDTQSELSETTKDQHKELIETIRQKNNQISQLLNDIELIENENINLKKQLSTVRDKLSEATIQINKMTDEFLAFNVKFNEEKLKVDELTKKNELFKVEIDDLNLDNVELKKQLEDFALAIDKRVDDWKKILDEKNEEIFDLKSKILKENLSEISKNDENKNQNDSEIIILNKIIIDRDFKINHLQEQLEKATEDMKITTELLNKLNDEKNLNFDKINELKTLNKELKDKLKTSNLRSKNFQEEITYLNEILTKKDVEIEEMIKEFKSNKENIEMGEFLEKYQKLKLQKRNKEKEIEKLVCDINKLQESFEAFQKENLELRSRLGLNEDENVPTTRISLKYKKLEKVIYELRMKISKLEEEKINLRIEVQKQVRIVNNLSKQLNDLDVKPIIFDENFDVDGEVLKGGDFIEKFGDFVDGDGISKETHRSVVEENEALRKGLHEILESLQERKDKGYRNINSETLDQLLKALDSKHISGWYHQGMRLQAEIHSLKGCNQELREQLKIARLESNNFKSKPEVPQTFNIPTITNENKDVILNLNQHLSNILKEYNHQKEENDRLIEKLEKYELDFTTLQEKFTFLDKEYTDSKLNWENEKIKLSEEADDVTEKVELLESKLEEIRKLNLSKDDEAKVKHVSELAGQVVILNRKCLYLENENKKVLNDLNRVKSDLLKTEVDFVKKINAINETNDLLTNKINILEIKLKNKIDLNLFIKLQNNFDNLTIKHRELLGEITKIKTHENYELETLKQIVENLKKEKEIILNKTQELILKINSFEASTFEIDKAMEVLTKKLSQSEINEITERQRANHMSNLYELVKEQLKKSEERLREFEKYNKEIMEKNLKLQESIKDDQNKILISGLVENDDCIKKKYEEVLIEMEGLKKENGELKIKLEISDKEEGSRRFTVSSYEYEVLSLKHQILDLQAATDDKAVICRLSSDVVQARLLEADSNRKLESLTMEFKEIEEKFGNYQIKSREELKNKEEIIEKFQQNISDLQQIIIQQRQQYLGYVPLISETKYIENILQVYNDKYETYISLQKTSTELNEIEIIKEQLKEQLGMMEEIKSGDVHKKISTWYNEKSLIQLQELKQRRKSEFIQNQLEQALEKIKIQDQHMSKLEEALFQAYQHFEVNIPKDIKNIELKPIETNIKEDIPKKIENIKIYKSEETQTIFNLDVQDQNQNDNHNKNLTKLQMELLENQNELKTKEETIEQLKSKITELEMNLSLFKTQLGDKQSQITFYEKHILELQSKKDNFIENEEITGLKSAIVKLQTVLMEKEEEILKYQSLLKKDRDEHSLAAQRMQEEVKRLQQVLIEKEHATCEKEKIKVEKEGEGCGKVAVEQYIKQVHVLVQHTNELHTQLKSLENQLQAAREESVRWRSLANDRLESMEKLRNDLEEMHKEELKAYKEDCEKWREEVLSLKTFVSKFQGSTTEKSAELQKLIKDKDNRIHELTLHLRQLRIAARKKQETIESPHFQEDEDTKKEILKELEVVKKKCENLLTKEKNYREEIRNLKSQLMKRPIISSARSDKSDVKDQLYKKISTLEKENLELKENLKQQLLINESHKLKVAEDFDKWNKQKFFQQTSEKLKIKLKEKTDEFEKLQQTCSGYRILIEKLEREKHALETKNKNLRITSGSSINNKIELLEIENAKLQTELEAINAKYEMAQHHSGGLGAAMLQEKLEAQERKIAILELAGKGTVELRNEIERLQCATANLHKANLRLEAENLEYKLDLEKSNKEVPHLKEQVQYLENYVEVLKAESLKEPVECQSTQQENKKVSELERTVFVLKRIVEKLQAENKRLQSSSKNINDKTSDETLRRNFYKLKDQYGDSVQKIARLEGELNAANCKLKQIKENQPDSHSDEIERLKNELEQKSELLDKVKILLHRAATKEKALLEEIARLKTMIPCSSTSVSSA